MPQVPSWLDAALASSAATTQRPPDDGRIRPGDLRVVRPMDGAGAGTRMVLVLEVDEANRAFLGALTTNETALAGANDVVIPRADSGLPYDLALLTTVQGRFWFVQADEPVALMDLEFVDLVWDAAYGAQSTKLTQLRGLALKDQPADLRWESLQHEAQTLHALSRECEERLAEGPPTTYADPALLLDSTPVPSDDFLLELAARNVPFSPSVVAWVADNPDQLERSRLVAFRRCLRYTSGVPTASVEIPDLRPAFEDTSLASTLIGFTLADAARDMSGPLRVLTWRRSEEAVLRSQFVIGRRLVELVPEVIG